MAFNIANLSLYEQLPNGNVFWRYDTGDNASTSALVDSVLNTGI